tara:strand:+ start:477 stop:725 length:249 start_codon:yes stop_codon:yes gene_type:complete
MFKDDPRAVAEDGGRFYPNYSGESVLIGKKMTIEEAQEMCRRDNAMNSVKKLTGDNTVLDRAAVNIKNYQLRKKQEKKQRKL